jgi:hypothetical protein
MKRVLSKDGTPIAFERSGIGQPLILVDGALCSRSFGPMPKLVPLLEPHFTVYWYDRRGRNDSGETAPYSVAREVEDLEAVVNEAGGSRSKRRRTVFGSASWRSTSRRSASTRRSLRPTTWPRSTGASPPTGGPTRSGTSCATWWASRPRSCS